jgi:hypothetical protein
MRKEIDMGENIPLTSDELRLQTAAMIEGLRFRTTIGAHGSDVHGNWCNNPFPIGSIYAHYPEDSIALARMIRDGVQPSEEFVFQQKELKEYHGGERNDDNTFIDVIAGAFMSSSPLSVTRSGIIIVEDMAYARIF